MSSLWYPARRRTCQTDRYGTQLSTSSCPPLCLPAQLSRKCMRMQPLCCSTCPACIYDTRYRTLSCLRPFRAVPWDMFCTHSARPPAQRTCQSRRFRSCLSRMSSRGPYHGTRQHRMSSSWSPRGQRTCQIYTSGTQLATRSCPPLFLRIQLGSQCTRTQPRLRRIFPSCI